LYVWVELILLSLLAFGKLIKTKLDMNIGDEIMVISTDDHLRYKIGDIGKISNKDSQGFWIDFSYGTFYGFKERFKLLIRSKKEPIKLLK
jgi:hypothetical protein